MSVGNIIVDVQEIINERMDSHIDGGDPFRDEGGFRNKTRTHKYKWIGYRLITKAPDIANSRGSVVDDPPLEDSDTRGSHVIHGDLRGSQAELGDLRESVTVWPTRVSINAYSSINADSSVTVRPTRVSINTDESVPIEADWYCNVCCKSMRIRRREAHLTTKTHIMNAEPDYESQDDMDMNYYYHMDNEISLLITNELYCCEYWDAKLYINGEEVANHGNDSKKTREQILSIKEKLIGQTITYIGFDVDAKFRHISDEHRGTSITVRTAEDNVGVGVGRKLSVYNPCVISPNEIVLVVDNIHNGYYSHQFIARFDGRFESGDL